MAHQLPLPFDLDCRQALLAAVPSVHRQIVGAVYDLADDHREWSGPARLLAAQMGCAPGTATRRAKRAAEEGLLQVELRPGRAGRYLLTGLPASAPSLQAQPSQLNASSPTWSDLRVTTFRAVGLLVALTFGAVVRRGAPKPRRSSALRRIEPLPAQLVLAFAACTSPNLSAPVQQPQRSSAQRRAEVLKTPENTASALAPQSAERSPIPFHSTVPLSSNLSDPIVPFHGDGNGRGTLKRWWQKDISPEDLRSPQSVQRLFCDATAAGAWGDGEQDRVTFFAWAKHVTRIQSIKHKAAVFTSKLGKPNFGKPFAARMAAADLDWARSAIKSVDLGSAAAPRTTSLLLPEDSRDVEIRRQHEAAKAFLAAKRK